jgi:phage-related protein
MGSDRIPQKTILSFREWANERIFIKKNKKDKKNEQSASQGSAEVGHVYQQRQADGGNQKIISNDVCYFTEPK